MDLSNIGVVIIVFHPNPNLLESKLKQLGGDVAIVVVDNTTNEVKDIVMNLKNSFGNKDKYTLKQEDKDILKKSSFL